MQSLKEGRLGPELSLQCSLLHTGSMKGVLEPNDFLRWGYVFQVIVALKFYKYLFQFLLMQSCTSVHEFKPVSTSALC